MFISNLQIKKYKNLEGIDIDFKDNINVLIGQNGSGKSAIIEVSLQHFEAQIEG